MRYKATVRYQKRLIICLVLLMMWMAYTGSTYAQDTQCEYWQSKVDPTINSSKKESKTQTDDEHIMEAIECLLKLQGRTNESRFRGATRLDVSQGFRPASVEVAALYYISYLYFQQWDHASAIALRDDEGEIDKPEAISQAYQSYRKWFEEVKRVGLAKAKQMKLRPLADIKVHWY